MVAPLRVIVAVGKGLTVTVVEEETAVHPFPSVIVTVKFPELVTVMLCDV